MKERKNNVLKDGGIKERKDDRNKKIMHKLMKDEGMKKKKERKSKRD